MLSDRCLGHHALAARKSGSERIHGAGEQVLGTASTNVRAHQAVSQLEHVVPQADDHELRILGALLDVVSHDRHVFEVCMGPAPKHLLV